MHFQIGQLAGHYSLPADWALVVFFFQILVCLRRQRMMNLFDGIVLKAIQIQSRIRRMKRLLTDKL